MSSCICVDCEVDTYDAREYYMVTEDVWSQTGLAPFGGQLCVGCIEKRIGRQLQAADFRNLPVNTGIRPKEISPRRWGRLSAYITEKSSRLQSRLV